MQTPAILNISSATSGPLAGTRPAPAASNGGFNQMLSQQIADRRDADKSAQARPASQAGSNEARQAETRQAAAKPADAKKADGNGHTDEAANTRDSEAQAADATAIPPTATELLAQAAAALIKPQPAVAADASAVAGSAVMAADGTAAADKPGLLPAAAPGLQREQAPATGGPVEFQASLRQAGEQQAPLQRGATPEAAGSVDDKASAMLRDLAAAARIQDPPVISASVAQLQPGGLNPALAGGVQPMERLTPHVGTPAWDQALGQKVVWMVAGAQQSAALTLNPPDLGPLQVVLNVSNGQADASFYADQAEVRQALEAALPKLRDMMSQAGVELGQTSVSAGMPERHDRPGNHAAAQTSHGAAVDKGGEDAALPLARSSRAVGGQGLVDTFA